MSIHVLSAQLASQIAAGEVVERPSSVVKELVENALDAGASSITVTVRGGGRELVQVADDGQGITADEIETAFLRHATSKLNTVADLEAVQTLGFRGEALAAISAVSRVTVVSRPGAVQTGTRLLLEGGVRTSRELVGAPVGTIIAVENLFYNTPARLKFLKSLATEKRLIDEFVTRYALAYPGVRFRLTHDNRITFQTTGSGNVREVLAEIYGAETARGLLEIDAPDEDEESHKGRAAIQVTGFAGPPDLNWANRSHITLFVNGRWIKDSSLTYAVIQAYHTLLPTGRYPLGVLFIEMPAQEVDVNVHPAKTEVRFRQPNNIFGAVQRAVRHTLVDKSPVRAAGGWSTGAGFEQIVPQGAHGFSWPGAAQEELGLDWSERYRGTELPGPMDDLLPEENAAVDDEHSAARKLPIMRVIGQVGGAYIITEGPDGLYLIDQHAAHERVLYEQFLAQWGQQQVAAQGLVTPAAVQFSPAQAGLLEENLGVLSGLGFQVEPFGPHTFQVRAVPAVVAKLDPAAALRAVVDDLEQGDAPLQGKIEARIVLRVCKSAAVKAGQTLSQPEMEALIQALEACESPHTCPHGRPTLIHLSVSQLAREFGRT
jgi:DNA mismatch repair protein MutL